MQNFSKNWFPKNARLVQISVGNVLKMLQMPFFWLIERPQKILIKKKNRNWDVMLCVLEAASLPFPWASQHIPHLPVAVKIFWMWLFGHGSSTIGGGIFPLTSCLPAILPSRLLRVMRHDVLHTRLMLLSVYPPPIETLVRCFAYPPANETIKVGFLGLLQTIIFILKTRTFQ